METRSAGSAAPRDCRPDTGPAPKPPTWSPTSARRRVVEALREARPQVILTAAPVDYLCDHEAVSALVRDACFAAPIPNYEAAGAPLDGIPHLYFMGPIGGVDRDERFVRPDFVIDI